MTAASYQLGGKKVSCGEEGEVRLVKSETQNISTGVLDEIRTALEKDHMELVVETAS